MQHLLLIVLTLLIAVNFADDLGWTDVGFHSNNQVHTPTIDSIYETSLNLNRYYVQAVCSPTRASIMTGRYPIRYGLQDFVIQHDCPFGLNLNETTLPEILRDHGGYDTHAVGKWHLGFYTWKHTPTFRGFNSYLGFYTGGQYYYAHTSGPAYDFRWDKEKNCGKGCDEVLFNAKGKYSTEVFSERAVDIVKAHDTSKPLFLYLSYQAVHDPSEVPDRYLNQYEGKIVDNRRKRFAAMVTCMDEGIGNVTQALKDKGMYDNSLIIFTTDNGGPVWEPDCNKCGDFIGANNYPLRAGKHSLYEGGGRGVSVLTGLNLPHATYDGLMHSTDWLPTIAHVAEIDLKNLTFALDGFDQWDSFMKTGKSPRTNILHNIEMTNPEGPRASYRDGDWKLIAGPGGPPYTWPATPNYEPSQRIKELLKKMKFPENSPLELFNVIIDPNERNNTAQANEEITFNLLEKIHQYQQEMFPAYDPYYHDPKAQTAWWNKTWMPWADE